MDIKETAGKKGRCKRQACQGEGNRLCKRNSVPGVQGPRALLQKTGSLGAGLGRSSQVRKCRARGTERRTANAYE